MCSKNILVSEKRVFIIIYDKLKYLPVLTQINLCLLAVKYICSIIYIYIYKFLDICLDIFMLIFLIYCFKIK